MEDGAVALGLHQGPDLGIHHPAAHRFATGPAPPPATLARFATRVPVQEMRQVSPRLKPGEEKRHDFFARGACFISILKEIRQFQWLRRTLKQGRVLEIRSEGEFFPRFPGFVRLWQYSRNSDLAFRKFGRIPDVVGRPSTALMGYRKRHNHTPNRGLPDGEEKCLHSRWIEYGTPFDACSLHRARMRFCSQLVRFPPGTGLASQHPRLPCLRPAPCEVSSDDKHRLAELNDRDSTKAVDRD